MRCYVFPMTNRREFLISGSGLVLLGATGLPAFAGPDAEITLKFATVEPSRTSWSSHIRRLKKRVKEETPRKPVLTAELDSTSGSETLHDWKTRQTELRCDIERGGRSVVEDLRVRITGTSEIPSGLTFSMQCSAPLTGANLRGVNELSSD